MGFSVVDAQRYIRQAHVVWVLTDIENPLEKQDITIARKAFTEGKIIIFVLSKSDKSNNPDNVRKLVGKPRTNEGGFCKTVVCSHLLRIPVGILRDQLSNNLNDTSKILASPFLSFEEINRQ